MPIGLYPVTKPEPETPRKLKSQPPQDPLPVPLRDSCLVKPDQGYGKERRTAGGLILPSDAAVNNPQFQVGTVMTVGEGTPAVSPSGIQVLVPMPVVPGDRVMFNRRAATPLDVGETDEEGKAVEWVVVKECDLYVKGVRKPE